MNKDCPLATKQNIYLRDLKNYIEIAHSDLFVPSLPLITVKQEELDNDISRRIFVFERASQFDLLSKNTETFMWVSLVPEKVLSRYGLVVRNCVEEKPTYKDVLLYKKEYALTELDKSFINTLKIARERYQK